MLLLPAAGAASSEDFFLKRTQKLCAHHTIPELLGLLKKEGTHSLMQCSSHINHRPMIIIPFVTLQKIPSAILFFFPKADMRMNH